jgi:hypothetical protein
MFELGLETFELTRIKFYLDILPVPIIFINKGSKSNCEIFNLKLCKKVVPLLSL